MKKLIGILFLGISSSLFAAEPIKAPIPSSAQNQQINPIIQPPSGFKVQQNNQNFMNNMEKCRTQYSNNPQAFQKCISTGMTATPSAVKAPIPSPSSTQNQQINPIIQPPSGFKVQPNNQNFMNSMEKCRTQYSNNPQAFQKCMSTGMTTTSSAAMTPTPSQAQLKDNPMLAGIEKCKAQAQGSQQVFQKCMVIQFPGNTVPLAQSKMQVVDPTETQQAVKPSINQPITQEHPTQPQAPKIQSMK